MVAGLKEMLPFAEEKKVTLCIEMLNSRVNVTMKGHPDYFCDSMERTVEICRQIGSPRCKVLFDIYHVQIMHGDVISRMHQYKEYIAHVHTAGVPGRNEIDGTQELNYPALMQALLDLGYTGFVGQEFIPAHEDKVASLADGVRICDVLELYRAHLRSRLEIVYARAACAFAVFVVAPPSSTGRGERTRMRPSAPPMIPLRDDQPTRSFPVVTLLSSR